MTTTAQPETKARSRRALLAGAVGGIGAWAASSIARPRLTIATNGDQIAVGGSYTSTSVTTIQNTMNVSPCLAGVSNTGIGLQGVTTSHTGVRGSSSATGVGVQGASQDGYGVSGGSATAAGVYGTSQSGPGVRASSDSYIGVFATSAFVGVEGDSTNHIGVYGYSQATDQAASVGQSAGNSSGLLGFSGGISSTRPAPKPSTGVFGYAAQSTSSRGVWGETTGGIGVYGRAVNGFAGYFQGKVFLSSFQEMIEVATPAAPGANRARLFVRDSAGKTQLCVRFPTGTVKVLATEA